VTGPFVELTWSRTKRADRPDGAKVFVNMANVLSVGRAPDGQVTRIELLGDEVYTVEELPEDVVAQATGGGGTGRKSGHLDEA
jgi:hypothetical protein